MLQLDRRVDEVDGAAPPEARVLLLERLLGVAVELVVEALDHELRGARPVSRNESWGNVASMAWRGEGEAARQLKAPWSCRA